MKNIPECTEIDIGDGEVIQNCNDCGAYAPTVDDIEHHKSCSPCNYENNTGEVAA